MTEVTPGAAAAPVPRKPLAFRVIKGLAATLIAAFILVVGGLGIVVLSFDPNQYKATLIKVVQEREHRTLTLPGTIELKLFPPLTLRTGPFTVSERDNPELFVRADDLRLHLDLFALLRRKLVVDRVVMVKPQIHIVRDAQGRFNFADLMPEDKPQGGSPDKARSPLGLSVHRLEIEQGTVAYDDDKSQTRGKLSGLNLELAGLSGGSGGALHLATTARFTQPALTTQIEVRGKLQADLAQHSYALRDIALSVQGDALGLKAIQSQFSGAVDLVTSPAPGLSATAWEVKANARTTEGRLLTLQVTLPAVGFKDKAMHLGPVNADLALAGAQALRVQVATQGASGTWDALRIPVLQVDVQRGAGGKPAGLQLTLASPLQIDLAQSRYSLPALKLSGQLADPGLPKVLTLALQGNAGYTGAMSKAADFQLQGQLAGSSVKATGGWQQGVLKLVAGVDQLDLADWTRATATPPKSATSKPAAAKPEQAIDLSPFKTLGLDVQVKVGSLLFKGMQWNAVQATLKGDRKALSLDPFTAQGFGGSLSAALHVDLDAQRYHIQQNARDVSIQPILSAMTDRDFLLGKASDRVDVRAQGATWADLLASVSGQARIDVRNGAIKGFNLAQMLRNARALLAARKDADFSATAGEQTDFTSLGATFALQNGIVSNTDLNLQSPLLRVGGQGRFDLPAQRMDYVLRPTVVGTLKGQGGADLSALRGVSVPVRLSGPFAKPAYTVLWSEAAGNLLRGTIKSKVQEELHRQLGPQPGKPLDNALPGLFKDLLR